MSVPMSANWSQSFLTLPPIADAFSAGVAVEEHVEETIFQMLDSFHGIFRNLELIARPTIAVVDGAALGGGCELVAACDIVIASERARFGQPEIKLGVFPPVAALLLPQVIGDKRARELMLTGELIEAAEAARLGLVNYLLPRNELEQKTSELLVAFSQSFRRRTRFDERSDQPWSRANAGCCVEGSRKFVSQ